MKVDTDVLEEIFPSYNLNFYFYFYFYTYTWPRGAHRTKVNNKINYLIK